MARSQDARLVHVLSEWFLATARDLPWRRPRNRTGYGALVAESMLQQTQVARVVERYPMFMKRFPNVRALAQADEQDVLGLWQGMGYYRRAKNLHAAAQLVAKTFQGRVPSDVKQLRTLPGVGRYTAGAIASIVFGKCEPIVDGNVQRVLARVFANRETSSEAMSWSWETAERLVSLAQHSGPGVFNEAMMELGATVCTPKAPKCAACPLRSMCAAHKLGTPTDFPLAKKRAKVQACVHHAVVVSRGRSRNVLLQQRSADGMWAGMWQVPTIESAKAMRPAALAESLPIAVSDLLRCARFKHTTTHRAITFHVYTANSRGRTGTWLARDSKAIANLPMSAAQRRVLELTAESG